MGIRREEEHLDVDANNSRDGYLGEVSMEGISGVGCHYCKLNLKVSGRKEENRIRKED